MDGSNGFYNVGPPVIAIFKGVVYGVVLHTLELFNMTMDDF